MHMDDIMVKLSYSYIHTFSSRKRSESNLINLIEFILEGISLKCKAICPGQLHNVPAHKACLVMLHTSSQVKSVTKKSKEFETTALTEINIYFRLIIFMFGWIK